MAVKVVPEGRHTVTARLFVDEPARLIEFLRHAFGARGEYREDTPTDVVIGDSIIMISGTEFREATAACFYLYLEDADAAYRRALEAGATSLEEPKDQFYGDRRAMVKDRFGNTWQIATRKEDLSTEEIRKRAASLFKR